MPLEPLDFVKLGKLEFEAPDLTRFPALALARQAMAACGTLPAVLNAANEVAVDRFMKGNIRFTGIPALVERVMARHENQPHPTLEQILAADAWARREAAGI